jgi:hypothetical protein
MPSATWEAGQTRSNRRRLSDVVKLRILKGLALLLGTADVIEFVHDELNTLDMLIFSTSAFGVSVGEDLYVVPKHSRRILKIDDHDVIHIEFRLTEEGDLSVSEMSKPALRISLFQRLL